MRRKLRSFAGEQLDRSFNGNTDLDGSDLQEVLFAFGLNC